MVRNYDKPDPRQVVQSIARVLQKQDMTLLSKGAYEFLITHCGFIAHYDRGGFIEVYQDDLPSFIDQFLSQHGLGWKQWLENPNSYLYDVSYQGVLLADIIRQLIPIFQQALQPATLAHNAMVRSHKQGQLETLARELGYDLKAHSS